MRCLSQGLEGSSQAAEVPHQSCLRQIEVVMLGLNLLELLDQLELEAMCDETLPLKTIQLHKQYIYIYIDTHNMHIHTYIQNHTVNECSLVP